MTRRRSPAGRSNVARIGSTHPSRNLQSFEEPAIDEMLDTLRERRIALKQSQKHVAATVGCSRRAIAFMENHQHMPSLSLFIRYAAALDYIVVLTKLPDHHISSTKQ